MKGYIDENGYDRAPCGTCIHKDKTSLQIPCCGCISHIDLALHKPNYETDFVNYNVKIVEMYRKSEWKVEVENA